MHTRREFLRRIGLLAAAGVAADQLELLERLAPRRPYFPGAQFAAPYGQGPVVTMNVDRWGGVTVAWDIESTGVESIGYEVSTVGVPLGRGEVVVGRGVVPAGHRQEVVMPLRLVEGESVYVSLRTTEGTVVRGMGMRLPDYQLRRYTL